MNLTTREKIEFLHDNGELLNFCHYFLSDTAYTDIQADKLYNNLLYNYNSLNLSFEFIENLNIFINDNFLNYGIKVNKTDLYDDYTGNIQDIICESNRNVRYDI